jgi:hypothetical protein
MRPRSPSSGIRAGRSGTAAARGGAVDSRMPQVRARHPASRHGRVLPRSRCATIRRSPAAALIGHRGRAACPPRSYEARKFGVRSAMPSVTAERLCPQATGPRPDTTSPSRGACADHGNATPIIEPVSIDEAFLDGRGGIAGRACPRARSQRFTRARGRRLVRCASATSVDRVGRGRAAVPGQGRVGPREAGRPGGDRDG